MPLTDQGIYTIAVTGLFSTSFSTLGSILVLSFFYFFPSLRTFRGRLVLYLTVANLIWILSIVVGLSSFIQGSGSGTSSSLKINSSLCQAQGFFLPWFIVSEDFWVATIAIFMYLTIVQKMNVKKFEWVFHVVNWGIPFIISLIPWSGVGGGYGVAGSWCWVVDPEDQLLFSYLFAWLSFVIIVVCYSLIILYIKGVTISLEKISKGQPLSGGKDEQRNRKIFKKLACFPVIFLIQWIPATINRVQNYIDPSNPIVTLYCFHVFFVTSSGFLNFIFYTGFNKQVIMSCSNIWSSKSSTKNVGEHSTTEKEVEMNENIEL